MNHLALSRLDKCILGALILLAVISGSYIHRITGQFEQDLKQQSENHNHDVARMVASLGSLEDDVRAFNFSNRNGELELVKTSFARTRTLIEDMSRSHDYEPGITQTIALQIAVPLLQDLSIWFEQGIGGYAPNSQTVLRVAGQRIYLARVQLEQLDQQVSHRILDLLNNQSAQLKSFGSTLILLIAGLLALLILAGLLFIRNRQAKSHLWSQQKMISDSINNINEGFILTDRDGQVRVVNNALQLMCPELSAALNHQDCYQSAMQWAIEHDVLLLAPNRLDVSDDDGEQPAVESPGNQRVYQTHTNLHVRVTERDTNDGGKVITFTDITDLKLTEDKLQRQAHYDYLTGIANRSYYLQRLQDSLARARRHNHKVALMQFDLDRFKQVNDTLGHAVGDELLIETARRIRRNLREVDLAARTGGDEFAAIIDQITDQNEARISAERIVNELHQELEIDGIHVDFSASIGIAIYPDHAQDIDTLMHHADIACYRAKASGRNNYQMYGSDMKVEAMEMVTLETKLRKAIDDDTLFVDYQPNMDLRSGELTGVEAFSRWYDNKLGLVSPAQFIPVADRNGLITKLGEQVLRKVFAQLQLWRQHGLDSMQVAINLSQRQLLQPNLTDLIDRFSEEYAVEPSRLQFEITESVISDEGDVATQRLLQLASRNIGFVIDDYGRGASSLLRISNLPIRALKLDGEFIRHLTTDQVTRDIVQAMLASAKNLQLDTIAECVETAEQADMLREMGCTMIQGFYVGEPQTPDQILMSFRSHAMYRQQRRSA